MLRPYGSMQISSCLLPHLSEHVIITMTVHCGSLYILVPHYFTLPWTGTRSNDLIDSQTMSRSWLGCGSGRRVCSTTSRSSWESTWTLLNMLAASAAFSSVLGLSYVMKKLDNTILQSNWIHFVQSEAQTSIFTWLQTSPQFEARYWKKLENPSDGIDFVWLYYWDGEDEKQNVGWWFADEIGSEKVSTSVGSLWSKCIKQIAYNYKTNKHSIMKHKK